MLFDIIGKFNGSSGNASQSGSSDEKSATTAADCARSLLPRAEALRILSKAPPLSNAPSSGRLESDVAIKGTLKSSHDLYFDGRIEGEIFSAGTLTVGENACVKGTIKSRSLVLLGRVEGNIVVQERCELKDKANMFGDITAGSLSIEEGASFMGQSKSGKQSVTAVPVQSITPAPVIITATPVIRMAA